MFKVFLALLIMFSAYVCVIDYQNQLYAWSAVQLACVVINCINLMSQL